MFEKIITADQTPEVTSRIFYELQEISGDACASWHATGPELAVRGLMWVVVRYEISLNRWLVPGETLKMKTWASPVRHRMSQRNYIALDDRDGCVFSGAGIWAVADRQSRSMVDPDSHGVVLHTETTGEEPSRPASPQRIPFQNSICYTVKSEVLDINGHMNNTKYFDAVQTCAKGLDLSSLRKIRAVFNSEAREGDSLTIKWGSSDGIWYFHGEKNSASCFQIGLETGSKL